MSLFRPTGQFDDADDEAAAVAEQNLAGDIAHATAAASRLAASRAAAMSFAPGSAMVRAAAERTANSGAASYLSLLQSATHGGDSGSPYFQRQSYRPTYMNAQSPYGGISSAEATLAFARHNYPYGATPGLSSDNGGQGFPGGYSSPHAARDFATYYQRQAQDLSSAALLDRAYQMQESNQQVIPGQALSASALQYLSKGQSTVKSSPASGGTTGTPRAGRGGRGGDGSTAGGGRGGGRGRGGRGGRGVSRSSPATKAEVPTEKKEGNEETDELGERWYSGCVPLGLPEDKYWLSELQVYLRSNFAEAFGATEADIAAPMHGRNKPIALGQVGIRCLHCRDDPPGERGQQATSYPSLISGIYNSVQQMLRLHYDCCTSLPKEVKAKVEQLKVSSSARGGRKQYWIDSAKRLGLVDTPHGIHFGRDPYGPLPPLSGPSGTAEAAEKKKREASPSTTKSKTKAPKQDTVHEEEEVDDDEGTDTDTPAIIDDDPVEHYPLVEPEDMALISDYLYLTLEQMSPCNLMEADKVGCYKGRRVGFRGLACKHCVGQAGCGRYFPASEASLSQTTTSQTIMNHVRNCRRCPIEIRENLELMKRARMGPDGKRAEKPKHGGRKVFFHRLWCRIQRVPLSDDESGKKKGSGTWSRKKRDAAAKKVVKRRRSVLPKAGDSDVEGEDEEDENDTDESSETETEEDDTAGEEDDMDISEKSPPRTKSKPRQKKAPDVIHEGCVRLTKTDDPHWLSEMQCFVRSDLVEVYSHKKKDSLDGYAGRKEPEVGQVGIRCVFCKTLPRAERSSGSIYFPDTLAAIQTKVGDMIRLHFPSCPAMPDDVKPTFRSLRGFGAKADGDAQQYWIDAARDIGLTTNSSQGWGIRFGRDPLQPSPADDLDRETAGAASFQFGKNSLVKAEDKGMCTDHAMLLIRQIKPCRFKTTDRRGGPGARGRDRVIGFPGVSCRYCSSKNNFGRYFPVSAKNLTDNTANSLQAHMMSCSRCPEPIKASLAYLLHRATLQKAELSGSWKKTFFKRVWERLHLERAWTRTITGEMKSEEEDEDSLSEEEDALVGENEKPENGGSDSDDEDLGEDMADLINAAAIWLSEQEANSDSIRNKSCRGRSLPSKRPLPFARGQVALSEKRRKVAS